MKKLKKKNLKYINITPILLINLKFILLKIKLGNIPNLNILKYIFKFLKLLL